MSTASTRPVHLYSFFRPLFVTALAAIALRGAVTFYYGGVPSPAKDETSYSLLAARLASGHGYSFAQAWYPFTPADTPTAHWSFLYTAFVAAVYGVAGAHPLAVRLVQAVVLGVLMPWCTWRLARRAGFEEPVALVAALLAAVYPYFVLYVAMVQTEGFFLVAVLWSLERALALRETLLTQRRKGAKARRAEEWVADEAYLTQRRGGAEEKKEKERIGERVNVGTEESEVEQTPISSSPPLPLSPSSSAPLRASAPLRQDRWLLPALTLGLSLGVAALLRQSILPWVVVLFAWLAWGTLWPVGRGAGRAFMALGAAGLVMVACIVPVTVRNYGVYGELLLLNSNAGYAMYSAQHPLHGTSFQAYMAAPLPTDIEPAPQNEAQWDRVLMARGVQFVLDDPGRYALLSLSRAVDYLEFWPKAESSLLFNVGRVLSFGWLLPVAVAGVVIELVRLRRSRRTVGPAGDTLAPRPSPLAPTALLLLFVATYSLLHILTWAMPRYRLPVDAVLVIFAAVALLGARRWCVTTRMVWNDDRMGQRPTET